MSTLSGRVAVITGASRGIGRALALGLAKAGCAVVIAAKSTEASEKLPGSIHTVAAEVEALGARALAVQVDVRDDAQVEAMAQAALGRLGRIDVLINNAGAMFWRPVSETPMKSGLVQPQSLAKVRASSASATDGPSNSAPVQSKRSL